MVAAWSTVVYGFSLSAIAGLDHDVALEQSRESDLELFQWKPVVTVIGQHLCGRYFFLPLGGRTDKLIVWEPWVNRNIP